jgi:hypothetical protein
MSIKFEINGIRTSIPGVYTTLTVEDSLPAPVPAGRSVLIIGEAEEGSPGNLLDLRYNFYSKPQDVKDYYKSGPIVDAANMLFSRQPAPDFRGTINRIYVYKTNQSVRAEKEISAPANYGKLVAARFGESGNMIKSQILNAQAEVKPTKTFAYLPTTEVRDFTFMVSGKKMNFSLTANKRASDFVTALALAAGASLTVSGGADVVVTTGDFDVDLTATGDELTISKSAGVGAFATLAAGQIAFISAASQLAGASDENVGAYEVVSASASAVTLRQLTKLSAAAGEENVDSFDLTSVADFTETDLLVNDQVTVSVAEATKTGSGATVEIMEENAEYTGAVSMLQTGNFINLLASATSSVAKISASVLTADGDLKVQLNSGSWVQTPKAGDLVHIGRSSLVAGATMKNVGYYVVVSATAQSINLAHVKAAMTAEAVSSVSLAGANDTLTFMTGWVSTSIAAKRVDSAAERKVKLSATLETTGEKVKMLDIGGRSILELSYYAAGATACTVSINELRVMTITPTGAGTAITINTKKYKTIKDLVSLLNSKQGVSAKASVPLYDSLPTSCLDMVDAVGILGGHSVSAYNGKIKADYYDWKQYFDENFSILAFAEGSMSLKSGLPTAESTAGFLEGGLVGASADSDFNDGFLAGLKVNVRHVIPLISRDAIKDIADGLTDEGSSYSIDSVLAQLKAHVSTANADDLARRRFGCASFDGSYAETRNKVMDMAFELCNFSFQRHSAVDANGESKLFLPWMSAVCVAAGRSQAILGTSMLRKPFLVSSASHTGVDSLYDDTLVQDFDPEDRAQLEDAIDCGLTVFREVEGFGVRMESPDNSSRSRTNDPKAWFYERMAPQFTMFEVADAISSILDNAIGQRQADVSVTQIRQQCNDALSVFLPGTGNGSLESARVTDVFKVGTKYVAKLRCVPTEAVEAIQVDIFSTRTL